MATKHRWRLEQLASSGGFAGDNGGAWEYVRDIWCEQKKIDGAQAENGAGDTDIYRVVLKMHFFYGLKNGMRFVRGDRVLKVDFFFDAYEDRRYLMARCTEVG